jgi:RNA polymerase sigma factor for flagellar operon FliA
MMQTDSTRATRYIPFVERIASRVHRMYGAEVPREDLVSFGMLGLIDAIDRFDTEEGSSFERYAYFRIFGAMLDGTRRWTIQRELSRLRRRGEDRDAARAAQGLSTEERVPKGPALPVLARAAEVAAQGRAGFTGLRKELCERSPESELNLGDMATALTDILDTLDQQERKIVQMYYFDDCSFRDVAAAVGCSPSWLSRMHRGILDKLRRRLAIKGHRRV